MRADKLFLILISLLIGAQTGAVTVSKNINSITKLLKSPRNGSIFLRYEFIGEPVNQPAKIEARVFCEGAAEPAQIIEFNVCTLNEYEFNPEVGELILKFTRGYMDGSNVRCAFDDSQEFAVTKICREEKKKKKR